MNFKRKSFFIGLVWIVLCPSLVFAASFEYLYVEASEGNSSGGHSAIEFGDEVYHFQHHDSGLIRLLKQDKPAFHFQYRFLQNRRIHLNQVEVSEETFNQLRAHFKLQFLAQSQQFNQLDQLHKDALLLRRLLYKASQKETFFDADFSEALQINGAGLFYTEEQLNAQTKEPATQYAPIINMMRKKIEQRYGNDYLNIRREQIIASIKLLTPSHWPIVGDILSKDNFPATVNSFADTYRDYITGLIALKTLEKEQNLREDAFFISDELVTKKDRVVLARLRDQLMLNLLASVNSKRPDWGYATLINVARLMTMDRSLQLGRWVFLDDYSNDSEWLNVEQFTHYEKHMQRQINDAKINLAQAHKALLSVDGLSEARYSQVEMSANRYVELLKVGQHKNIRYIGEKALPTKSIGLPDMQLPELTQQKLLMSLNELDAYEGQLLATLKDRYRYDLVTRNCVTELFKTMDQALLAPIKVEGLKDEWIRNDSENSLGGRISGAFNFIPFISFQAVQESYRVSHSQLLASYRDQQLAKIDDPMFSLREANTLTSTLYKYNSDDAFFIFFTDNSPMLRPIFGLFNTVAGMGQSVFGLVSWPYDSGKNLKAGATGILMSLPELLFFNMRKGSYPYLSYNQFVDEGQ